MEEWRQGLSVERDALEEEKEEPGRADRSGTALPGLSHWLGGSGEKGGALVGQDDVLKVFSRSFRVRFQRNRATCGFSCFDDPFQRPPMPAPQQGRPQPLDALGRLRCHRIAG